ncbi:MAG: FadR/GntR family transcriptional regulator [Syntrophobacter sp.]
MGDSVASKDARYRYEEVVERIQEMIRNGEVGVGERLPPERVLADAFNVSRNCLRQAIQTLSEKKVLESRRGAGTYVRAPDDSPTVNTLTHVLKTRKGLIREVMEFRGLLEPSIAALAATNISPEELDRLKIIVCNQEIKIMAGAEDAELDSAFHFGLAVATKNKIVMRVAETLNEILNESRSQPLWNETRREASVVGHLKIIDALEAGDADAASAAMREHLLSVERIILD